MARSKKVDERQEPAPPATLNLSLDDFIRTRDSVVTGLATLQSAVQDLSRAYIAHTNTVIGKGPGSSLELLNLANPLGDTALFGQRAATPALPTEAGDGKKPKTRRPHDKNAPKRALTPFFLYMQTARPVLARAKPKATAKEIADEGTKRWQEMEDDEKLAWQVKYAVNLARYHEKVKAYKAGLPIPEISDEEAKKIYESQKKAGTAPTIPKDDVVGPLEDADAEDEADVTESVTSNDEEDDSPEPPKAPSPPKSPRASKRRKTNKDSGEKASSPVKATAKLTESPVVERSSQSPEKERKKKGLKKKKVAEDIPEVKKVAAPVAESSSAKDNQKKEKKASKKRRSKAVDDEE